VEAALKRLGADLRAARLRRNLTIAVVAEKIGTGPRAVMDAEKGKASTGAVVFAALLWTYGLLDQLASVADPSGDTEGQALAQSGQRQRSRSATALDDDF
jgi:transcriptional regulator with XRE-family HTH domain